MIQKVFSKKLIQIIFSVLALSSQSLLAGNPDPNPVTGNLPITSTPATPTKDSTVVSGYDYSSIKDNCWVSTCNGTGTNFSSYEKFCLVAGNKIAKHKKGEVKYEAGFDNLLHFLTSKKVCQQGAGGNNSSKVPSTCKVVGVIDSYVLAISWQPQFCNTKKGKPECDVLAQDRGSYNNKFFSLHGLWPNRNECGINLGFCDPNNHQKKTNFCDYPDLDSQYSEEALDVLKKIMPSYSSNSCLDRYEWTKHGTCQKDMNASQFFTLAGKLTIQFNESQVGNYLSQNVGADKSVSKKTIEEKITAEFGEKALSSLKFICDKNNLSEIRIILPGTLKGDESLAKLIPNDIQSNEAGACGDNFVLPAIGE